MTKHIPISEFKDHMSELVAAAEAGDDIVLTRHGKPTVRLVAIIENDDVERRRRAEAALAKLAAMRARLRAEGRTVTMQEWIDWKNEGRP